MKKSSHRRRLHLLDTVVVLDDLVVVVLKAGARAVCPRRHLASGQRLLHRHLSAWKFIWLKKRDPGAFHSSSGIFYFSGLEGHRMLVLCGTREFEMKKTHLVVLGSGCCSVAKVSSLGDRYLWRSYSRQIWIAPDWDWD